MRRNPWHLRFPTAEHYQWFRNLADLHELTLAWAKEIQADRPSYFITRGIHEERIEKFWMGKSLSKVKLDDLLEDSFPEELLFKLEQTVWSTQSLTLANIYSSYNTSAKSPIESLLEQICWRLGKSIVEQRWSGLVTLGKSDPREILLALNDSPFSGYPHGSGFLIRRSVASEIQIELHFCPHQSPFIEVKPVADSLCRLHTQWMRGFAYGLNHRSTVEHIIKLPRCTQSWFLTPIQNSTL